MFIADAFLGNFDRHNGNWGFLVDEEKQQAELAPVYDCGSCLYPQLDLERMKTVLQDEAEIDQRIYTFPTSSIEEGGKKISYFDYISSLKIRIAMRRSSVSVQESTSMRSITFSKMSRNYCRSSVNST